MSGNDRGRPGDDLPGRLTALVKPLAASQDLDLLDLEVVGPRNRRVVRIVADAAGGLGLDQIAELSRAVGDVIDDVITGAYTLEVTSPGTDRPLRAAGDFRRHLGREVRVQRTQAAAADAPGEVTGTVVAVEDDAVVLDVDDGQLALGLDDVDHAKVVLPW